MEDEESDSSLSMMENSDFHGVFCDIDLIFFAPQGSLSPFNLARWVLLRGYMPAPFPWGQPGPIAESKGENSCSMASLFPVIRRVSCGSM